MHEYMYKFAMIIWNLLPDGSPRKIILLNVYAYIYFVKIGGNKNNTKFSKQMGALSYFWK